MLCPCPSVFTSGHGLSWLHGDPECSDFGFLPRSLVCQHSCLLVPSVISSRHHLLPFLPSQMQTALRNYFPTQVQPVPGTFWRSHSRMLPSFKTLCLQFFPCSLLPRQSCENTHQALHPLSKFMQWFLIICRKSRFLILKA